MALRARYFGYLGVILLLFTAALLAVFGLDAHNTAYTVQISMFILAGFLIVTGGFPNSLRERVGAFRLIGLGDICLGASMVASAVTITDLLVLRVSSVLGGLCIALIGVNYLTNGRFFETSLPEPQP